jgi:hypothetical protein
MPPEGFEPAITAGDHPQTHPLNRSATGIGLICYYFTEKYLILITLLTYFVIPLFGIK